MAASEWCEEELVTSSSVRCANLRNSSQDFPKFDVGIPLRRTEKQSGDGDEDEGADWDAGDVGAAA